jgi:hypothetical protein
LPQVDAPRAETLGLSNGELASFGWDVRLTLTCLQGIVNRAQPRLYLVHDYFDELWLDWMRQRGDVDQVKWLDVGQVFELFLPEVKVVFVTDQTFLPPLM